MTTTTTTPVDTHASIQVENALLRSTLVNFKGDLHKLAMKNLTHFHNCGNPVLIQEFFDILDQDKLLRKIGFAKWVVAYSNAVFTQKTKKFSKNTDVSLPNKNIQENVEIGTALLSSASTKKFWEMDGGEESIDTSFDKAVKNLAAMLKRFEKDIDDGVIVGEAVQVTESIMAALKAAQNQAAPLTTKVLKKAKAA